VLVLLSKTVPCRCSNYSKICFKDHSILRLDFWKEHLLSVIIS